MKSMLPLSRKCASRFVAAPAEAVEGSAILGGHGAINRSRFPI
jgi:hypothetical protein